jgi:hypothetical protein
MTDIHWTEAEELAAKICGLGDDYESDQVEQALFDKYEISFEKFNELIEDLVPLCEVGVSPLTDQKYRGFADVEQQCWIVKVDASL